MKRTLLGTVGNVVLLLAVLGSSSRSLAAQTAVSPSLPEAQLALAQGRIIADKQAPDAAEPAAVSFIRLPPDTRQTLPLPPSGAIAFASDRAANQDVYSQPANGATAVALVSSSGDDVTPVWSPDGTQLLFASNRDGDFDIYRRDAAGLEHKLTFNAVADLHPSWSPDGQQVLFSSERGGSTFQIYTMTPSGGNIQQVGVVANNNALYPRYAPDGRRLAFMRASIATPACSWNWDIWLMDADGSHQRRITNRLGGDLYPVWTPDGTGLLYASCRNLASSDLYFVNADTGQEFQLTAWPSSSEWGAVYSPQTDYLAFNADLSGNAEIYQAPAAGGTAVNFTDNPAEDIAPSWGSPPDSPPTYTLSGEVQDTQGNPLVNVIISAGEGYRATTDGNGRYTLVDLLSGIYTLIPSLGGYSFAPTSRTVAVPPSAGGQNFTGQSTAPTEADRELAERFAPYLYRHAEETYWPTNITPPVRVSRLIYGSNNTLFYPRPEQLDDLPYNTAVSYLDFPCRNASGQLNVACDDRAGQANYYSRVLSLPAWQPRLFARVQRQPEQIVLQYWFFYYDNPGLDVDVVQFNHHEGDWEMVQVVLDAAESPLYATFAQHEGGTKRLWSYIDHLETHPQVYYAKGSHASYFKPYPYRAVGGLGISLNDEPGEVPVPLVELLLLNETEPWLAFLGHWGRVNEELPGNPNPHNDGPTGPTQKGEQWHAPQRWGEQQEWDELAGHNANKYICGASYPADVHVYNRRTNAHVGRLKDGTVEVGIPHAEYIDNPLAQRRTILVHVPDALSWWWYRCVVSRPEEPTAVAGAVPISVTVNLPDYEANEILAASFAEVMLDVGATAVVSSTSASEVQLLVDKNGDGTPDAVLSPSRRATEEADLTPPEAITDLTVTAGAEGLTLHWTAPRDGGHQQATAPSLSYDIRIHTSPITATNWATTTRLSNLPAPLPPGTPQTLTLSNLPIGTYYLAMQTIDAVSQTSPLSNNAAGQVIYRLYLPVVLQPT